MPSVVVIGAGPAGSTAALLLARGGWTVTLVEQSRFPREKVCGECLSAVGVNVLARSGVLRKLLEAGAVPLRRAVLYSMDGAMLRVPLARGMLGVSRGLLDSVLLRFASDAGATILQPARCEQVWPCSRPRVRLRDLLTNRVSVLESDVVLLADGKSALIGSKPPATSDLGLKAHFVLDDRFHEPLPVKARDVSRDLLRDASPVETGDAPPVETSDASPFKASDAPPVETGDASNVMLHDPARDLLRDASRDMPHDEPSDKLHDAIELFGFDGHYGGLSPIEGKRWNFAISIPAARMRACRGDGDAVLSKLLTGCPALRDRLRGARRVGEWLASPLPRFAVLRDWPTGVIPIGNAAAAIEPIGGEGMGLALRSAELAARWLLGVSSTGRSNVGPMRAEFVRLWRRRALVCRVAAGLLSRRWLAGRALRLAGRSPPVVGLFMDWMGKRAFA